MKSVLASILFIFFASAASHAQTRPVQAPAAKKSAPVAPVKPIIDRGNLSGRTYTNQTLNFSFTLPDTWLVQNNNFEEDMKKEEFQFSLGAPDSQAQAARTRMNRSLNRVVVLVTAYHQMAGSKEIVVLRVTTEDLKANPQIKDAVDYFDAIRASYRAMKLPADFKYSETTAEQLGKKQFGVLDITSNAGKKRMYATVRNGFAIMFTLSYTSDDDLQTVRGILTGANFKLK